MIISLPVSIKQIRSLGRSFPWPRPPCCPSCHHPTLWGHGFVPAYFDDLPEGILLRRLRCPCCGAVHRLKPAGYFRRFQASISSIRHALWHRLQGGRSPTCLCRVRVSHWLKGLKRQVAARLGLGFNNRLLEGFDLLAAMGIVAVGRSI